MNIGLRSWGTCFPVKTETSADISAASGIPETVVDAKMGLKQKHIAGDDDHCSQMAARAGMQALERASLSPRDVDLIIYHGSEYKDHIVWSAATRVQDLLGAENSAAFEIYALCAGAPVALKAARAMMNDDGSIKNVLLVTATRENDLVNYRNERTRYMFNFGSGAGAMLLQRGYEHNLVLSSSIINDSSLSCAVMMPGGGSRLPFSECGADPSEYKFDVPELEPLMDRLGKVSMPNFKRVIRESVEKSGFTMADIGFLAMVHMKRSFHEQLLKELGLGQEQAVYLDMYGHMQSVDQVAAIDLGHNAGLLKKGKLVVMAAAGAGYTWSASSIRWG